MRSQHIHTVPYPVLEMPRSEIGILAKKHLKADLEEQQAKRKTPQVLMLESLTIDGVNHPDKDEILKLITSEFQCDMVEIASGNGQYHTEYNPDGLRMAQANDSINHETGGLAESIMSDKEVIFWNQEEQAMEQVCISQYSIWDTIFQKGQLIVRITAPWKSGFNPVSYVRTKAKHAKEIHNKLLGLNNKFENKATAGYEARKAKRMERLRDRVGNTAKIGYNAIQ